MTLLHTRVFSVVRSWNTLHQLSKTWLPVEDAKISSQQRENYTPFFWNRQSVSPVPMAQNCSHMLWSFNPGPSNGTPAELRLLRDPFHSLEEELGWDKCWKQVGSKWVGMSLEASAPASSLLAMGEMREPQPPLSTAARATVTATFLHYSAGTHLLNLPCFIATSWQLGPHG